MLISFHRRSSEAPSLNGIKKGHSSFYSLNLGVAAWAPLSNGLLTGKYHGHGSSDSGRMNADMFKEFMPDEKRTARIIDAVKAISGEVDRSMAQVALAWLRARPVPVIPIIGARKLSQLQNNIASLDLVLSPVQLRTLDQASEAELGFPQALYKTEHLRAICYAGMAPL